MGTGIPPKPHEPESGGDDLVEEGLRAAFGPDTRAPDNPSQGRVDEAFVELYRELRELARLYLSGERKDHSLQATALVHEAYLRLLKSGGPLGDPSRFHRAAATAMRRILVDHARKEGRIKRGGNRSRLSLDAVKLAGGGDHEGILAVEGAIRRLEGQHEDLAEVVRLRFYAGLSVEETAWALGRSPRTVAREWAYAKALLYRWLGPDS